MPLVSPIGAAANKRDKGRVRHKEYAVVFGRGAAALKGEQVLLNWEDFCSICPFVSEIWLGGFDKGMLALRLWGLVGLASWLAEAWSAGCEAWLAWSVGWGGIGPGWLALSPGWLVQGPWRRGEHMELLTNKQTIEWMDKWMD